MIVQKWLKWRWVIGAPPLVAWHPCRPVIVLHFWAQARAPVAYMLNENDRIARGQLERGEVERFYTPMFAPRQASTEVSLPILRWRGRDDQAAVCRVDMYIDQFARIERTDVKYGFLDRFMVTVTDGYFGK
ncbi:hypothetical protein PQQ64_26040 [Paraburkholderia graminis]|uniref:hypothetical protein n=1 Tax=Paraburkholderia graminis TaxID=60548 RepID=UPI0038BBF5F9